MITEQFSIAPLTKTRSFLILFVCFSFFFFFLGGGGGGGFLNSESREKNYSALDVLLVIHTCMSRRDLSKICLKLCPFRNAGERFSM